MFHLPPSERNELNELHEVNELNELCRYVTYKSAEKWLAIALVICSRFFGCSRKVTALYSFHLQKLLEDVGRKKFKHDPSNNDINRAPPKEDSYSQATRHHNDLHKLL